MSSRATEKHDENQEALREQMQDVIRDVARKPELIVRTELTPAEIYQHRGQNLAKVWFRQSEHVDPRTGKLIPENVRIPDSIMEGNETAALGIAAHEGAHSSITRLMEAGAEQYEGEPGLMGMLMALEERPTDEEVRAWSEEGAKWIGLARFTELAEGLDSDTSGGSRGGKYQQLCNLLVYAREEEIDRFDPEVVKLYEEIRSSIEFVETCLPERTADEETRVKMAKVRLQVAIKKIWPKVRELYEETKEENLLQDLLQQILSGALSLGGAQPDAGAETGAPPGVILELPPDLAAKLASLLPKSSADLSGAKRVKPSEELLQALRAALKHLPEPKKQELEERAKHEMEEIEQKLVDEHAPKMQERPRSAQEIREESEANLREHRERAAREADERKQQEIAETIREEEERVRRELAALQAGKSVYDGIYEEVRESEQKLYGELKQVFHPLLKTRVRMKSSGSRINLPAFMRWDMAQQAGKLQPMRFFESVEKPEKKDYAITLLVDLSFSMQGEKIAQTLRAVVILTEVLNRLGLNFELLGFQDQLIEFKKFGEKVDDRLRQKISGMLGEVTNSNPDGHNRANYNDDGPCLREAAATLSRQSARNRFLVVLSDGHPAGSRSTEHDLTVAVSDILAGGKVNLVALGLGPDTEHVKKYYPVSLPNILAEQLSEVLPDLLKDIINNPRKYKFTG